MECHRLLTENLEKITDAMRHLDVSILSVFVVMFRITRNGSVTLSICGCGVWTSQSKTVKENHQ
jgi:hypothetical protein